ncbi:MAG: hypothetical protein M1368_12980 [Thaumarchaeota archaeon]|nr:hypothetical protein [Nitrososphaerota archaeon]
MIGYALSVAGILGATLIPVYIALYLVTNLKQVSTRYLAAAGLGLVFWFFFDTMGNAAQLDVNESFTGGAAHVGIVIAFVVGVAALCLFDHFAMPDSASSVPRQAWGREAKGSKTLFLIPAAVAAVTGIHGLGEGWDFASAARVVSGQTLAAAFGGLAPLASYPLHKFLEASIVAAVYTAFVGRSEVSTKAKWHLPVLGLLFGMPSVIGAAIGYYVSFDTTYFYAFGVTAALYAALRLAEATHPQFKISEKDPSYLGGKIFVAILIGFLLLYGAALLH